MASEIQRVHNTFILPVVFVLNPVSCERKATSFPKGTITLIATFSRVTDLHNVFDQRLVRADLCTLQPADAFPDPGDEGELGSFAHGISRRDPDKAEQTSVV